MVFSFLPVFEGDNFGKDGEREMKVNGIREQNLSLRDRDYNTLLLGRIWNTGYADLLDQRFPDSIKKN